MQVSVAESSTVGDEQAQTVPEITKLFLQDEQVVPLAHVLHTVMQARQFVPER